ncbi:hypothetical protein [Chryseobacterium sp. JUb7]|uniref:hypothetical protein n=1 Tax=Chryseobacterium sp. JUb7 TaxID=2940599 RepID=UPI00216729BA|nr:hypothetical protein [Chryseobacterium sp. JUb7]MCS3532491.1 hypothetical protein [Chryseobacterium sp. JUb7]
MIRFWFVFDFENYKNPPGGLKLGCGVTAISKEDALNILKEKIFRDRLPPILNVVENIKITDLDNNDVLPNMNSPVFRGIWFPMGYDNG